MSKRQEIYLQTINDDLLRQGVVEPCKSEWNSPVCLVPKGDSYRFTVDYKQLNKTTLNDDHPLPLIRPLLQRMTRFKYFAKIDLSNGYWHVPIADEASRDLTAYTVPGRGQFRWTRLAQGLKQAPSAFQRYMDQLLDSHRDYALPYIDDTTVGAMTPDDLDQKVRSVLDTIQNAGLIVNKDKTTLFAEELKVLGHRISHGRLVPDATYVDDLARSPIPSDKRGLRRFLGKLSHVLPHYPQTASDRQTLFGVLNSDKTRSSISIKGNSLAAWERIIAALRSPVDLQTFDASSTETLTVVGDAGSLGYAAFCQQGPRTIGIISRKYPQRNMAVASSLARESFAMAEGLLAFQEFTFGRPVIYLTDNKGLARLMSADKASHIPFINRQLFRIGHLRTNLRVEWRPREDTLLSNVDQLGRLAEEQVAGSRKDNAL